MNHNIDPIIATVLGVHLWWYGLSYAAGFLNAHLFFRRNRARFGLSLRSVYALTLCLAVGVLAGGRALVVFVHEWALYREHPAWIPAVWLGGMATHGLLAGGCAGVLAFCLWKRLPFRPVFDALAIPAAVIMGLGRIGNFIDGQIVGSLTDVPWGVQFPDADGFRHPVVLYDGLKNFLLIPILMGVRRRGAPPGRLAVLFVILYAALRIPVDLFREYPINALGLPDGQGFNVIMTIVGMLLLILNWRRFRGVTTARQPAFAAERDARPGWLPALLVAVLLFSMVISSDATRDVPARYGHRHPGLQHSALYPPVDQLRTVETDSRSRF